MDVYHDTIAISIPGILCYTGVLTMFSESVRVVIDRVDRLRDQVDDHWQIPRDEAMVLAQLVRVGRCVSICEIGTSYGFSTLHLAAAASEHGGRPFDRR